MKEGEITHTKRVLCKESVQMLLLTFCPCLILLRCAKETTSVSCNREGALKIQYGNVGLINFLTNLLKTEALISAAYNILSY